MVVHAYTDGSFNTEDGRAHGGIVMMCPDGVTIKDRLHVISTIESLTSMRNVGGEIVAAWAAAKSISLSCNTGCFGNEPVVLIIHHDYEGVSKWCTGEWRAKKPATIWYKNAIAALMNKTLKFDIQFEWVRGHGDSAGNKEADAVASYDMSGFDVLGIKTTNLDNLLKSEGLK